MLYWGAIHMTWKYHDRYLGYMYPLEQWFSPGTCPGVGLLEHIVRNLHTVSQSGCTNLTRLAKSSLGFCCNILQKTQTDFLANIYIPTNSVGGFSKSDLMVIQVKTWWELWNNPHSWVFSSLLCTSTGTTDYFSVLPLLRLKGFSIFNFAKENWWTVK